MLTTQPPMPTASTRLQIRSSTHRVPPELCCTRMSVSRPAVLRHGREIVRPEVGPDPYEAQRMSEHPGLQRRVGAHLDHDGRLDTGEGDRQPAPAETAGADALRPRVVADRRGEDGSQLGRLPGRERAGPADDDQFTLPVPPGDELAGPLHRADDPAYDHLGGLPRLDLEPLAAAGCIPCAGPLRDEALDPGGAVVVEPALRLGRIGGRGR